MVEELTELKLRPATRQDGATIRRMVRAEGLDPTSLKWQRFMVAEVERKVVGIGQVKEYPGCQELGSLVVLPEYRGQGIAADLIAALEAHAGRPLYLLCRDRMQPYYERFGYQQIPIRKAPPAILWKLLASRLFLLAGVRIVLMWKT